MSRKSIRLKNIERANKVLLGESVEEENKKECTCDECDCNGECNDSCECKCCK